MSVSWFSPTFWSRLNYLMTLVMPGLSSSGTLCWESNFSTTVARIGKHFGTDNHGLINDNVFGDRLTFHKFHVVQFACPFYQIGYLLWLCCTFCLVN